MKNRKIELKQKFFKFTLFRVILFFGLAGIFTYFCVFGPLICIKIFGEGNTYRYNKNGLAVHYLDVGQGDCIAIQFPDGRVAVIDGGEQLYYTRVRTYLKTRILKRNQKIDFVINTHPDSDHCGGLTDLLNDFQVDTVFRPYNESNSILEVPQANAIKKDSATYSDFITAAYQNADNVDFVRQGVKITDNNFYMLYFHTPDFETIYQQGKTYNFNEVSPIITLQYCNQIFVLTGDAGYLSEEIFERSVESPECGISISFTNRQVYLKVGHHGGTLSTTEEFLDYISPDYAVISFGENNFYGHPTQDVLERLYNSGIGDEDILTTPMYGNIVIRCDGDAVKFFFRFDNPADWKIVVTVCYFITFTVCFLSFDFKGRTVNEK